MKWKSEILVWALTGWVFAQGCATTKPPRRVSSSDPLKSVKQLESAAAPASVQSSPSAVQPPTIALASTTVISAEPINVGESNVGESNVGESNVGANNVVESNLSQGDVVIANREEPVAKPDDAASVPINLPTALAAIGGQHPVVGFAQWRVQEAYAQLDRARVMWLPSIQAGMNYRRHDGNYQAVDGSIVDVNLNSLNYGLGAGAIAAGSQTRPGVVAQFHLADAIFLSAAAEKTAWARGHAAAATLNEQLLNGAIAYMDLLESYQDLEIVNEAVKRTSDLARLTAEFADAGEGLLSDADRTATELTLLTNRQLAAQERQLVASTRLSRALSIPMSSTLVPQDAVAVPLDLVQHATDEATLIAIGLQNRPELKESQALVAAACEAFKREKYAPFVPSVLLGLSTSSFGGGLGSTPENYGGRYDMDALMVWETRNLGFGEAAARRERHAQVQQATFAKLRMMDQVAGQVAEANAQVRIRKQQLEVTQAAIDRARDSYDRNIDRIREAKGLPIEALQAIQALEAAQRAYMRAAIDYNRAQLQLQWSLGWSCNQI